MGVTRYGFTGPMAAYGTFQAKSAAAAAVSSEGVTSMLLMGVGRLWWLVLSLAPAMRRLAVPCMMAVLLVLAPQATDGQTSLVTFETVTVADSAIGFSATTIRPASGTVMTVCTGKLETATIRYRVDGTAPTATVGALVDIGDIVTIRGLAYLTEFRGIRTGGTSGSIDFHCYRQ